MVSVVLDVRVDVSSRVKWNAIPRPPPHPHSLVRPAAAAPVTVEALLKVANAHVHLEARRFASRGDVNGERHDSIHRS